MSLPPEANNNLISYHFIWIDQNRRQNVALMELIIISLEKIGPGDFFKEAKLRVMQWQSVCDSVWFRDFFVFSHFLSTQFLFFSKYKKRTWAGNENLPSPAPPLPVWPFPLHCRRAVFPWFRHSISVAVASVSSLLVFVDQSNTVLGSLYAVHFSTHRVLHAAPCMVAYVLYNTVW